ncbi:MAG TPA: sulfotransferase [Gaiellales bacterium]|nr:sulfotransferase [Gaiellales bacterium]
MSVRPLFVLSLPRSGSTLLQRMLATHPEVATSSEPWILLPQLYALRPYDAQAEYGHRTAARALHDFCDVLPGGRAAYLEEVRRTVLALYEQAAGGATWFVDKTPRYHLVVDEIMELFPGARFVFLWRHPLAVAASVVDSFGRGHWNIDRYGVDLYGGLDRLVAAQARNDPRARSIRYEDLVADPEGVTAGIFEFLDLPPAGDTATRFTEVDLAGRMGDRTGRKRYDTVTEESVSRWRETMRNPLRKRWCAGYLRFVGPDRMGAMGYDAAEIEHELSSIRTGGALLASDAARRLYGYTQRRTPWNLSAPRAPETAGSPSHPNPASGR